MRNIKKNNTSKNVIKPLNVILINERGEAYRFTERTYVLNILKKIRDGFNKIYAINLKNEEKKVKRIEKNYYEIITCKFEGDRNLYVIESKKLSMLLKIFMINFVGKLSLFEDYNRYDSDKVYDVFMLGRKKLELIGIIINKNIITIDDINEIEKIISEKIMNFDNIKINSLLVKDLKKNNLNILKVRNIEIKDKIEKIKIKFNNCKKGIEIQLNEYSVLFELLYSLASVKIDYFTDA